MTRLRRSDNELGQDDEAMSWIISFLLRFNDPNRDGFIYTQRITAQYLKELHNNPRHLAPLNEPEDFFLRSQGHNLHADL